VQVGSSVGWVGSLNDWGGEWGVVGSGVWGSVGSSVGWVGSLHDWG
jgi:hypothetical protein